MSAHVDEQTTLLRRSDGAAPNASRATRRWSTPSVFTAVATIATVVAIARGARQMWTAEQSVGGGKGHPATTQPPITLTAKPLRPLMRVRMWGDANQANRDNCATAALAQSCDVHPKDEEFCVFVNTNDYYYRVNDGLRRPDTRYFKKRVASDAKYKGTLLQTLFADPEFSKSDFEARHKMLGCLLEKNQCEIFGDDTLLMHIRSGDSGWEAQFSRGDDDAKEGSLGMIDANAIAGIMDYLDHHPQITRVIMRTMLHFGVLAHHDSMPRRGFSGKTSSEMRSTQSTLSPFWGIAMFLSLVSAALLSVATLHPDRVFSTLSTPKIGSLECGAMDLDCWKREAEKVGDLKNDVSNWQNKANGLQNTVSSLHAQITDTKDQIDARVTQINARVGNLKTIVDLSDDGVIPGAIKNAMEEIVRGVDGLTATVVTTAMSALGQNDVPKVIFHAHMAKTAGSTFNRFVARIYHVSCGNKGKSFAQKFKDQDPSTEKGVDDDPGSLVMTVFGF